MTGIGLRCQASYCVDVLPYPNALTNQVKAAFCQHERTMVRKKPACWTCSWCEKGTDVMVTSCTEARRCLSTQLHSNGNGQGKKPETFGTMSHAA